MHARKTSFVISSELRAADAYLLSQENKADSFHAFFVIAWPLLVRSMHELLEIILKDPTKPKAGLNSQGSVCIYLSVSQEAFTKPFRSCRWLVPVLLTEEVGW